MTLETGSTLGKYQILGRLGQGGMATVYKAFQPSLEREVALKVLRAGFTEDEEFLDRFRREAKAIAHLRHANIVQVFDFEEVDGRAFMAMEFLEGGTLKARMNELAERGQRLPHGEVVAIVQQVADALAYAHRLGVVHRDVKPSNVMLLTDGRAVVTDFGIAKVLSGTQHTQTGVGVGTPEYMSPEQGQGKGVDQRADIYSLGVMTYEMLTGRVPFTADTPLAIVLAHIRDALPLPSQIDPTVGPATERVLLKALAKEADQRYDSATAFADALRVAVADDETGGTMPTIVTRRPVPAAAGTPAAASAAVAAARPGAPQAATGAAVARPSPASTVGLLTRRPAVLGGAVVGAVVVLVIGGIIALGRAPASSPASAPSGAPAAASTKLSASTPAPGQVASPGPSGPPTEITALEGDLLFNAKLDPTSTDIGQPPGPAGQQNAQPVLKAGEADLVIQQQPQSGPGIPTLLFWRRGFPPRFVAETEVSIDEGSQLELWWVLQGGEWGQDALVLLTSDETMQFVHQGNPQLATAQPQSSGQGQQYCPPACPGSPAPGTGGGQQGGQQQPYVAPVPIGPTIPVAGLLQGHHVTLGVAARGGSRFTVFLNGKKVADVTDPDLPGASTSFGFGGQGMPGLGFDAHGINGTVRVYALRVYTLK